MSTVLRSQAPAVHTRDVRPVGQPTPAEREHAERVQRMEQCADRIAARGPGGLAFVERIRRIGRG